MARTSPGADDRTDISDHPYEDDLRGVEWSPPRPQATFDHPGKIVPFRHVLCHFGTIVLPHFTALDLLEIV